MIWRMRFVLSFVCARAKWDAVSPLPLFHDARELLCQTGLTDFCDQTVEQTKGESTIVRLHNETKAITVNP